MKIQKSRIMNLETNLKFAKKGNVYYVALKDLKNFTDEIKYIGFDNMEEINKKILPKPKGSVSKFNSKGTFIKHKDKPMEKVSHSVYGPRSKWAGRGKTEMVYDFMERSYKRYPRTPVEPLAIELIIIEKNNEKILVATTSFKYGENDDLFKHTINLFLELFGECEILNDNFEELIDFSDAKRLNWKILPPGDMPWKTFKKNLSPFFREIRKSRQIIVEKRLSYINKYKPNLRAYGIGGFSGYVILGFGNDLFVLESMYYGNATYILGKEWEEISKKTKKEILDKNLHIGRIVHGKSWQYQLNRILLRHKKNNNGKLEVI